MSEIVNIDTMTKAYQKIYYRFPLVDMDQMPKVFSRECLEEESERISKYHIVLWHRLLRKIFGNPSQVDMCIVEKEKKHEESMRFSAEMNDDGSFRSNSISLDVAKKLESGELVSMPIEWRYYLSISGGGIVEIGSKESHCLMSISRIDYGNICEPKQNDEIRALVTLLVQEAEKDHRQIFNPMKEFSTSDNLSLYMLDNLYKANYNSAHIMFATGMEEEKKLIEAGLKDEDGKEENENKPTTADFLISVGMYNLSSIAFFFMALEAFINIVFHIFLKKEIRLKDLSIESRLDIEFKLNLMPSLCDGFLPNASFNSKGIIDNLKGLKKYRNTIFHAGITESLKRIQFIEDGFLYGCDLSDYKKEFLPVKRMKIQAEDVFYVKGIVDDIIKHLMDNMTEEMRGTVKKNILDSQHIIIAVGKDNSLRIFGD